MMDGALHLALEHPGLALAGRFVFHALWLSSAVAILAALALAGMGRRRAEERYALASAALVVSVVSPLVTTLVSGGGGGGPPLAGVAASSLTLAPAETWLRAAGAAWAVGVLALGLRWCAGIWRLRGLTRRGVIPVPSAWAEGARAVAARLDLRIPFALSVSERVDVPTVVGWMRPAVLMPASALSGLEPRLIEALMAHELAHVRRHDVLVNHLQTLAETLLFFHPAVRWISRRMRVERELCCDDLAAAACGDPVVLARALVAVEDGRCLDRRAPPLAASAAGGSLVGRVRRLVGADAPRRGLSTGLAVALASPLGLALCLAAVQACAPGTTRPVDGGGEKLPDVDVVAAVSLQSPVPTSGEPFRYDPFGKRDPYRAYDATIVDPPARWRGTPAQDWELDQLSLVGILRDGGDAQVMLEDPRGQGHVLGVGDFVGKRHGQITRIQDRGLVVTEWIRDVDLGRVPVDHTLALPEPG